MGIQMTRAHRASSVRLVSGTSTDGYPAHVSQQREHIVPFDIVARRVRENARKGLAVMSVEMGAGHGFAISVAAGRFRRSPAG